MRPQIQVRNYNRDGEFIDGWQVRVGDKSRVFDQSSWENGGIEWINLQIASAGQGSTARVGPRKDQRPRPNPKRSAPRASKTSSGD